MFSGWVVSVVSVVSVRHLGDEPGEQKYDVQQNQCHDPADDILGGLAHAFGIRLTLGVLVIAVIIDMCVLAVGHGTRILAPARAGRTVGFLAQSIDSIVGRMTQC